MPVATGTVPPDGPRKGDWVPTDMQAIALSNPSYELFYGGAKGGGKTEYLLIDFLKGLKYGEKWNGILFRRSYPELEKEIIERSQPIFGPGGVGGEYSITQKMWKFPSGSTLRFRQLETDQDVNKYQGNEFQWIGFDELTSWPSPYCYDFMFSCNRSADGIPCYMRSSGNPGMPGHAWVKKRFIDPMPPLRPHKDKNTGLERVFVPAKVDDNPHLFVKDPMYVDRLKQLPPHLYEAFRHGDWEVFVGQVFEEYDRATHVIKPIQVDPSWFRFCSFDWGFAAPFSVGWWAVTKEGRMIRYKEWYGCDPEDETKGCRMAPEEVAQKTWEMSIGEGCKHMVADPSCWINQGMGLVADRFNKVGWIMEKGQNDRLMGVAAVHDRLKTISWDKMPMLQVFDTCRQWIRTIPMMIADLHKPEDVDTRTEDHIYDETRYACMSQMADRRVNREQKAVYEGGRDDENYVNSYNPLRPLDA